MLRNQSLNNSKDMSFTMLMHCLVPGHLYGGNAMMLLLILLCWGPKVFELLFKKALSEKLMQTTNPPWVSPIMPQWTPSCGSKGNWISIRVYILLLIILYIQTAASVIFRRKSECMGVIFDHEAEVGKDNWRFNYVSDSWDDLMERRLLVLSGQEKHHRY